MACTNTCPSCCPSAAKASSKESPRGETRTDRPAEKSLFDSMRDDAGTRLYDQPVICWTDLHARLLGVEFDELPTPAASSPMNASGASRPLTDREEQAEWQLTQFVSRPNSSIAIGYIMVVLDFLWPDVFHELRTEAHLPVVLGKKVLKNEILLDRTWADSAGKPDGWPDEPLGLPNLDPFERRNTPTMCWISRARLENMCARCPGASSERRGRNSLEEVYLANVFLVMAQSHFYGGRYPPKLLRDFEPVKLRILSHGIDTADFVVYTCTVSIKFLERFHKPFEVPAVQPGSEADWGLKIEYSRVPMWPLQDLRERLGRALGTDLVGPVDGVTAAARQDDDDNDDGEEQGDRSRQRKRRRSSVSERTASGPYEAEDELRLGRKKRRVGEAVPSQ